MSVDQSESADNKRHFKVAESPPSVAVIEAMAFVTNQDPLDIEPLADVIDPDAFDRLLSRDDTVTVSFRWEEHEIKTSASGEIIVSRDDHASK